MTHLRLYCLLVFSLLLGSELHAQYSIGNLAMKNKYKGDHYFLAFYYEEAIKYYKLALKKEQNKDALRMKIGESYRMLGDYTRASIWYEQGLETDSVEVLLQKPEFAYHYGNMLLASQKYDEAKGWFQLYGTMVPQDLRTEKKLAGIERFYDYYADSALVVVSHLPFNTSYSEIAATPYGDGLVFASERPETGFVDHDYLRDVDLYDLYFISKDSTGWGSITSFDKVINSPFQEGPVSFYSDQKKLILTRSNYLDKRQTKSADEKTNLQLYMATQTGDLWANIQPLNINNAAYSLAHPSINAGNDTLIFVSNMPGGFGGTDLYMAVFDGKWSEPVNLGPNVNTEGDELYPTLVMNRLFFSSDGRDGLGGLDVYKAGFRNGAVSPAVNMGAPINSPSDDFSYTIDPETKMGYLSSTRFGGKGKDDIYTFQQKGYILAGVAVQEQDGTLLSGVQVNLIQNGLTVATTLTGTDGSFRFQVPLDSDFDITATKDEHSLDSEIHVTTRGARVDVDSVIINMYKHDFFARGLVYDNVTQSLMHDVRVMITPEGEQADTLVTGMNGLYSFVLRPGKNYTIKAEKDGFTPDSLEINTRAISKGIITNDFALEEKYIQKETIFFGYDKFDLEQEATPALENILKVLRRYPKDWLIIGAHADSRGREEYNQELSEKRARAVVDYFTRNGISRDRIIARGFGEGLVINRCVDGVNCREEDHGKNRRAEIAVEEKLPEEERQVQGF